MTPVFTNTIATVLKMFAQSVWEIETVTSAGDVCHLGKKTRV